MKETVFCVIVWVQTKALSLSLASFITLLRKVRNIFWGVHLEYTNTWTPAKQEKDMFCESLFNNAGEPPACQQLLCQPLRWLQLGANFTDAWFWKGGTKIRHTFVDAEAKRSMTQWWFSSSRYQVGKLSWIHFEQQPYNYFFLTHLSCNKRQQWLVDFY